MVTVKIICVGKLKEKYWQDACNEYAKRLRPFCKFEIIELPEHRLPNNPSDAEIQAGLETEGAKILEAAGNSACIPLCIEGNTMSSPQMAKVIEKITNVLSKSLGTDNALNMIKAAAEGLKELSSPEKVAERRGITVSEMFVGKEN